MNIHLRASAPRGHSHKPVGVHPYDGDFYRRQCDRSRLSASRVVPWLVDLLGMTSVCDIGCGVGTWLAAFIENGVTDVVGVDGSYVPEEMLQIPKCRFWAADLGEPIVLNRTFDVALSLEVAEHLSARRAESFVSDLVALSPVVVFSAAIPGQGGTGHINEQWPDYWMSLFRARGYLCFDAVRPRIWNDGLIDFWYRQNTFIYCDERVVHRLGTLNRGAGPGLPCRAIHPEFLTGISRRLGLRTLLGALPRALRNAISLRLAGAAIRRNQG